MTVNFGVLVAFLLGLAIGNVGTAVASIYWSRKCARVLRASRSSFDLLRVNCELMGRRARKAEDKLRELGVAWPQTRS